MFYIIKMDRISFHDQISRNKFKSFFLIIIIFIVFIALGAAIGGFVVTVTGSFSATIFWVFLIAGIFSTCLWIPLFFTAKKDYIEINKAMEERASSLNQVQQEEIRE